MASTPNPKSAGRRYYWLLIIPFVATLIPQLYASREPQLFDFPYFYWYQFLWIVLSAIITAVVYVLTK